MHNDHSVKCAVQQRPGGVFSTHRGKGRSGAYGISSRTSFQVRGVSTSQGLQGSERKRAGNLRRVKRWRGRNREKYNAYLRRYRAGLTARVLRDESG